MCNQTVHRYRICNVSTLCIQLCYIYRVLIIVDEEFRIYLSFFGNLIIYELKCLFFYDILKSGVYILKGCFSSV